MLRIALDATTFDNKQYPSALVAIRKDWDEVEKFRIQDIKKAERIATKQGRKGIHFVVVNPDPMPEYATGIDLASLSIWID